MSSLNVSSTVVPRAKSRRTRQNENLTELVVHLEQVEEEIEALKLLQVKLQHKIAAKQTTHK